MPIGGIGPGATNSGASQTNQGSSVGGKVAGALSSAGKNLGRFMSKIGGTLCHCIPTATDGSDEPAEPEISAGDLASRPVDVIKMSPEAWKAMLVADRQKRVVRLKTKHRAENLGKSGIGGSMNESGISRHVFHRFVGKSNATVGIFKTKTGLIGDGGFPAKIAAYGPNATSNKPRSDAALPVRAVASSAVADCLNLDVLAASVFATLDGEEGYVSAMADGIQFWDNDKKVVAKVDVSKPVTQRQLMDLQALDFICGQVDRHAGNLFIQPNTGKVTGIDNDMAFGLHVYGDDGKPIHANCGLPPLVDARTASTILALSPQRLETILRGVKQGKDRLTDAEIRAALERLETLQRHIESLRSTNAIIDTWNRETFERIAGNIPNLKVTPDTDLRLFEQNLIAEDKRLRDEGKLSYLLQCAEKPVAREYEIAVAAAMERDILRANRNDLKNLLAGREFPINAELEEKIAKANKETILAWKKRLREGEAPATVFQ